MDAFTERKGVVRNVLRFSFNGQRIAPDQTPKMLEMEDNDVIDVYRGVGYGNEEVFADTITLLVKEADGQETTFKVNEKTKMIKVLDICVLYAYTMFIYLTSF